MHEVTILCAHTNKLNNPIRYLVSQLLMAPHRAIITNIQLTFKSLRQASDSHEGSSLQTKL
jgi:hypothetical protein